MRPDMSLKIRWIPLSAVSEQHLTFGTFINPGKVDACAKCTRSIAQKVLLKPFIWNFHVHFYVEVDKCTGMA